MANFVDLGWRPGSPAGCKAQEEEKTYGGPDTGPAYGDLFIDASIGDASTLLPPLAVDAASANINSLIYNGLVKYDGNLNLVGDLAESWDISPDGLTITFHLRQGVKWQDGAPFTAQDVLFTYQVMVDPKTPTAYSGDYLQVKKAEAPDDYTFRVTYPQPFAPALGSWGLNILPRHLLAGVRTSPSHPWRGTRSAPAPISSRSGGPGKRSSWLTTPIILRAAPISTATSIW